jgi:hypothetical protein
MEIELIKALMFYANPNTYFAIGFFPDPPCGKFIDDFDKTKKPGALARKVLKEYCKRGKTRAKQMRNLSPKIRVIVGALDTAFSGEFDLKKLQILAEDFIEHLEKVHEWRISPPKKDKHKLSRIV